MNTTLVRNLASLVFAGTATSISIAQANYAQNFDNVAGGWQALESQGWIIRPVTAGGQYVLGLMWVEDGTYFPPYQGAGCWYMGANIAPPGTVANWTILPSIPNQVAGDTLRFYCRYAPSYYGTPSSFEVRYSSGGTNTGGSNPNAVGDFTTVLTTLSNPPTNQWFPVTVTIPGNGRVALRGYMNHQTGFQDGAAYCIDSLAFNPTPTGPPFPDPGQIVHWTAAMSPISLSGNNAVVGGGTLIIDAGVTVNLAADCTLNINGTLHVQGTAAQTVTIDGTATTSAEPRVVVYGGGRLLLDYASVDSWIQPYSGDLFGSPASEVIATNSSFIDRGKIEQFYSTQNLSGRRAILSFDNCQFSGVQLQHNGCQALVRDCVFTNGGQWGLALEGYSKLENVMLENTQLYLGGGEIGGGLMYVDDVTVRNYTTGGGLYLSGARSYQVGSNVMLENNLYPVEFAEGLPGGLERGSILPASGNINNYIADTINPDPGPIGGVWANVGIPYVVRQARYVSNLTIEPGTTVKFMPDTNFFVEGSLGAIGTPEAPITFEAFTPAQPWYNILFATAYSLPRVEHCIVRDSTLGLTVGSDGLSVHNCLFENNMRGITNSENGIVVSVTSSTFRNNSVALAVHQTPEGAGPLYAGDPISPNIIEGNGWGVVNYESSTRPTINVANNWWGSPSGPTYELNPGGTGDAIDDDANGGSPARVTFAPYVTERPDLSDPPPVVRLITVIDSPEPGDKIIVHWDARDNGTIVRQRVLFSDFNNYAFEVLADNLPPGQRAFEFIVPNIGFNAANVAQSLRIEAIDDAGRTGYDETSMFILTGDLTGTYTFTTDFSGPFTPGSPVDLTWTHTFPFLEATGFVAYLEADAVVRSWGGGTLSHGNMGRLNFLADHSTDFARVRVAVYASVNRIKEFYSPAFTIRPDARISDAPPQITLTGPIEGSSFAGGSTVPLSWTASDDEALRDFTILGSYDGGRAYHAIATDLPPAATSYLWRLPASTGIADVRVRVVARDVRFQTTSQEVQIHIGAGDGALPGDVDSDGDVDLSDLATLLSSFGSCSGDAAYNPAADFDADGCVDLADLATLLSVFGT